MVNEEDHLRIQGVTAGLSIDNASSIAEATLRGLRELSFARTDSLGYLAASPFNSGLGTRHSCMMHLIGLAHARRLPAVMKALAAYRVAARGLFGESSRAIGALVQVSVTNGSTVEFAGACQYLIREERLARRAIGREGLVERAEGVRQFAITSRTLSLADGLRIIAWSRWAQVEGVSGFGFSGRHLDGLLTTLEVRGGTGESAGNRRAELFRELFEGS
jgi:protein arginine kinase